MKYGLCTKNNCKTYPIGGGGRGEYQLKYNWNMQKKRKAVEKSRCEGLYWI